MSHGGLAYMADGGGIDAKMLGAQAQGAFDSSQSEARKKMIERVAALKSLGVDTGGVQPWSAGPTYPMHVYRSGLPGGGEGFRGTYLHADDYQKAPTPYRRTYDEAMQDALVLLKSLRRGKIPKFADGGLSQLKKSTSDSLREVNAMMAKADSTRRKHMLDLEVRKSEVLSQPFTPTDDPEFRRMQMEIRRSGIDTGVPKTTERETSWRDVALDPSLLSDPNVWKWNLPLTSPLGKWGLGWASSLIPGEAHAPELSEYRKNPYLNQHGVEQQDMRQRMARNVGLP